MLCQLDNFTIEDNNFIGEEDGVKALIDLPVREFPEAFQSERADVFQVTNGIDDFQSSRFPDGHIGVRY
jgi:hypothetical protein